jgi:SM-20-related protein
VALKDFLWKFLKWRQTRKNLLRPDRVLWSCQPDWFRTMISSPTRNTLDIDAGINPAYFERLAQDISDKGYSIHHNALPGVLGQMLLDELLEKSPLVFKKARIGRNLGSNMNALIRTDEISWIDDTTEPGAAWIDWTTSLKTFLNARLFLGLFSFESHFARFSEGDYYRRHLDAFSGDESRILSIVIYLNKDWSPDDGGELVLFPDGTADTAIKIAPQLGTVAVFLSKEIPHEVLVTNSDRLSIAGWFHVNVSNETRINPPR